MINGNSKSKRLVSLLVLLGLLMGAVISGVLAFNGTPALAQTAGTTENEVDDDDDGMEGADIPITGSALEKASSAALDYIGEGRVTGTEAGDEEGYYEVEITRPDGSQVDVHLDEAFNILSQEIDE